MMDFGDWNLLQFFDFARFLIARVIPGERKARQHFGRTRPAPDPENGLERVCGFVGRTKFRREISTFSGQINPMLTLGPPAAKN